MATKTKKSKAWYKGIGDLLRRNAYVIENGKKKFLQFSTSAEKEYISRILAHIEITAPGIAQIAHNDKRSRIEVKYKETKDDDLAPIYDDVTRYFGRVDSKIADGQHIYCTRCLKKIEKGDKK